MNASAIPPTSELFPIREMASRHPHLLSVSRLKWALRNRDSNGLCSAGAVFETRGGELLIREPSFLAWFLGLEGRSKPRSARRGKRKRAA